MTPSKTNGTADRVLDDLVAELTDSFHAGDRSGVDSLLAAHPEHAGRLRDLLHTIGMVADLGGPHPPPAAVGLLGDFRLLREVGRGGMGVVYEAEQISLGRRVALKVLPFAAAVDPQSLARFRIEAQAAAQLHHTHIVPVYAVGSERGLHYYAMQFIEGRTLAELIADLRSSSAADADPASSGRSSSAAAREAVRTAARLGVQAAEALEHAHSLGVVHRDVKPANLLVDDRGHLWVADFGLARLGTDGDLTLSGHLPGTLRYMSPEQALGRRTAVDGRSDVYGLGVTLYELLTLRPAFDGHDRAALFRQVTLDEPRLPRSVNPAVPRDLETILLKAMAKEPEGRYGTARELADDLRHFLDDRPIRARRPSPLGLVLRWSRRHRPALAATLGALVLATVVGAALLWRAKGQTEAALRSAQAARSAEREALRFTFAASDQIAARALARIAAGAPPAIGEDGEFCKKALGYYEEIARRYADDAGMRETAAAAYHRVGYVRAILGLDGAEVAYRRSLALYDAETAAVGPRASRPARHELSIVAEDLGYLLRKTEGLSAAEPAHRRALDVRRALADESPEDPLAPVSLAITLANFAALLEDLGRDRDADAARVEILERSDAALGCRPDDAALANNLAWRLVSRPGLSPDAARRAVGLARRAVALDPKSGTTRNTLGMALYRAGDLKAAVETVEESMTLREGGDPNDWLVIAMARWRQGDRTEGRSWLDRSTAWFTSHPPPDGDLRRLHAEADALIGLTTEK